MRMMIESELVREHAAPRYRAVGVWVQEGDELVIRYVKGQRKREREVAELVAGLGGVDLPGDFLDYWWETMPGHVGMMSVPVAVEGYATAEACAAAEVRKLEGGTA